MLEVLVRVELGVVLVLVGGLLRPSVSPATSREVELAAAEGCLDIGLDLGGLGDGGEWCGRRELAMLGLIRKLR